MFTGMNLVLFLGRLLLGMLSLVHLLMIFCAIWSKSAEEGLFRAYSRAGGPTEAGNAAFSWWRSVTYS